MRIPPADSRSGRSRGLYDLPVDRIVITGWGAVSGFGLGRPALADGLLAGVPAAGPITRFDASDHACRIAVECRDFKREDFQDGPARRQTGRVVALALAAAREALRQRHGGAELPLERRRRVAVIVGSGGAACAFAEQQYAHWFSGEVRKATPFAVPSITPGTLASELSMAFALHGPSHLLSTGCTSAADALGYARLLLAAGKIDGALVGGVDDPLAPGILAGFELMGAVTTDANDDPARGCRPFNRDRAGMVLAEGAFFFHLEREAEARAAGARPLAALAGHAATCEAFHRVRIAEDGGEPARAIREALDEAEIKPRDLSHVAAHGTGTALGDRLETRALKLALGAAAEKIPVSAVKSLLGHPQGASAAQGLAAALVAFERGAIPPTANLTDPDPACALDHVARAPRKNPGEWALVNCIGFGSKNTAMVVKRLA